MKPAEIEKLSFEIIDGLVPAPRPFNGEAWAVARRLIHTSGDVDILKDLVLPESAVSAGIEALKNGADIFTDTQMARVGISSSRLRAFGSGASCLLDQPGVCDMSREQGITRSRAAVLLARKRLGGSIVVIGNAPTSLEALLEILEQGAPAPALIIGMPVGFVNATESKDALYRSRWPHLSLRGRKGGSTMAAAVVNALAVLAGQPVSLP